MVLDKRRLPWLAVSDIRSSATTTSTVPTTNTRYNLHKKHKQKYYFYYNSAVVESLSSTLLSVGHYQPPRYQLAVINRIGVVPRSTLTAVADSSRAELAPFRHRQPVCSNFPDTVARPRCQR